MIGIGIWIIFYLKSIKTLPVTFCIVKWLAQFQKPKQVFVKAIKMHMIERRAFSGHINFPYFLCGIFFRIYADL